MLTKDSKILVVGAGAIGGISAAFIKKAGYNVEIACKHQELADKVKAQGLHVFGVKGEERISMPAVALIRELKEPKDIVLLAVKATDMLDAAKRLRPFLKKDSVVLSMQNGICQDALAKVLGRQKVIACVIAWGATMHNPGELEMTCRGKFLIGDIDNRPNHKLPLLKDILNNVAPVEISRNIKGKQYFKLIFNCCITSISAICGLKLSRMLSDKKIRNIFAEIANEAFTVAGAMDIKVDGFKLLDSKLDYYRFLKGKDLLSNLERQVVIRLLQTNYDKLKSSVAQSLERKKRTEIDYLNGYITANAKRYNIPTPVNAKIVDIIKDIEKGKREISPRNLEDPFFAKFM